MTTEFKARFLLVFILIFCTQCKLVSNVHLEYQGKQVIKHKARFKGLRLGGFSGATFLNNSHLLILSDDKKNHRFYKFKLTSKNNKNYKLKLRGHTRLKSSKPLRLDPEGIAYRHGKIFISSEGQQIFKKHDPPQILRFSLRGTLRRIWPTPKVFWQAKLKNHGAQENKGFESVGLHEDMLWTATEKSLKQDSQDLVRISGFNLASRKLKEQYLYTLQKGAGLTEMLPLDKKIFLTLERIYDPKAKKGKNLRVYLYEARCDRAVNLLDTTSVKRLIPCKKRKLFDFSKLPTRIDNLEAMALGPKVSPKTRLLVLASDNNFNAYQQTQILFFHLKHSSL